ncbi:MAG: NAD-dependent epimerase/dehydratase family protein [Dehalococcoidia bacterium]|nr:NAD-dependent epimerase/dehydratase family protein [Dehalococcoidia bacterium]
MNENLPTKTAIVTGSAGFIGKHLIDTLMFNREVSYHVSEIDTVATVSVTPVNISKDEKALAEAIKLADEVYHFAGIENEEYLETHPDEAAAQVQGTSNVLRLCYEFKKPVVITSSSAVYGPSQGKPLVETDRLRPETRYAETKLMEEDTAKQYASRGLKVGIARLFSIYGPGMEKAVTYKNPFISNMILRLSSGMNPQIFEEPDKIRDFLFIDDAVQALLIIMKATVDGKKETIYNVGSGSPIKMSKAAVTIAEIMLTQGQIGNIPQIRFTNTSNNLPKYSADTTRMHALEWRQKASFAGGVAKTAASLVQVRIKRY